MEIPPYNSQIPSSVLAKPTRKSTAKSCAACRHQRRRCAADCLLAPYFPNHQPQRLARAHRLFGIHNIVRTLRAIPEPNLRQDFVASIVFEANARFNDPVGGSHRILLSFQRRVQSAESDLRFVRDCIDLVRAANSIVNSPFNIGNADFGANRR